MISLLLLGLCGVGYLAATVRFQKSLYAEGEPADASRGRTLLYIAFALHTVALAAWVGENGRFPARSPSETLAMMAWMMMALYIVVAVWWRLEMLGAFAAPLATLLVITVLATEPWARSFTPSAPLGPDPWLLGLHVAAVLLGYAAFLLATMVATLYYFQTFLLKSKNVKGVFRKIPPLETLDRATYHLVTLGFPAMVLGIALAYVRTELIGHPFWSVDVLLGLITCAIYAIYIHARIVSGWQGRKVNMLLVVGFVFLVATYIGAIVANFQRSGPAAPIPALRTSSMTDRLPHHSWRTSA